MPISFFSQQAPANHDVLPKSASPVRAELAATTAPIRIQPGCGSERGPEASPPGGQSLALQNHNVPIPHRTLGQILMRANPGGSTHRAGRKKGGLSEPETQFVERVMLEVSALRCEGYALSRDPENIPAMERQGSAAIRLAGSCKAWVMQTGFEFEPASPRSGPKASLAIAEALFRKPDDRMHHLVQAIEILTSSLKSAPRNQALLGATLQCAEQLSALSIKQSQEIRKLDATRRMLDQRQQWIAFAVGSPPGHSRG